MSDYTLGQLDPAPQGCICPPTSEQTCQNPTCPRKPVTITVRAGTALKEDRGDRIEELEAENKLLSEGAALAHFQGVVYARNNLADALWTEFKDKWDGERKFALRQIVKRLKEGKDE